MQKASCNETWMFEAADQQRMSSGVKCYQT